VRLVDGLLAVSEIFGKDLPRSAPFQRELVAHLDSLLRNGARMTVQSIASAQI
jgi:fructuronate reductase